MLSAISNSVFWLGKMQYNVMQYKLFLAKDNSTETVLSLQREFVYG